MPQVNRRKIYLIEKRFQLEFIFKLFGLAIGGGLITIGVLYLFATRSNTVAFVNSRVVVKTTADFILPILLQTVLAVMAIVGAATIIMTLFFSHKVAGPLYHLRKAIKEAEAGDLSADFRLRHLDQLQELGDSFNAMIQKMRSDIKGLKESLAILKNKLDALHENDIPAEKRSALAELKKIAQELNNSIKHFKT